MTILVASDIENIEHYICYDKEKLLKVDGEKDITISTLREIWII